MSASTGTGRDLKVVRRLRDDGWAAWTAKNDGRPETGRGQGPVDVIAMKPGERPRLIQVKSTAGGPYERFGPVYRAQLREEAKRAGAVASPLAAHALHAALPADEPLTVGVLVDLDHDAIVAHPVAA
jgi:hypothetical protein